MATTRFAHAGSGCTCVTPLRGVTSTFRFAGWRQGPPIPRRPAAANQPLYAHPSRFTHSRYTTTIHAFARHHHPPLHSSNECWPPSPASRRKTRDRDRRLRRNELISGRAFHASCFRRSVAGGNCCASTMTAVGSDDKRDRASSPQHIQDRMVGTKVGGKHGRVQGFFRLDGALPQAMTASKIKVDIKTLRSFGRPNLTKHLNRFGFLRRRHLPGSQLRLQQDREGG